MKNKFSDSNPEALKEFMKKLNELVEDFHHEIYLLDDVFKGVKIIETAIFDELNRDKAN